MHKQNARRGFTRFFPVPLAGKVACKAVRGAHKGFTLIELLVAVLIIGILAAVAVPQYQVAVKKAQLAKYIPLVKTFTAAEEAYYLANGTYTTDLMALDVEIPSEGCSVTITENSGRVDCGTGDKKITYIMVTPQAVQSGDYWIRYVYYLADDTSKFKRAQKGETVCFSKEIARKVCKTLGSGEEKADKSSSWDYYYKLD